MSILKWVGGKKQLLTRLTNFFPENIINYYEPFGGSLTVTLHVWENYPNIENIYVSDINPKLINLYVQLKKHPFKFLEILDIMLELNEDYNSLRDKFNTTTNKLEEAVLMFLINKKCFNGLYRVNKAGKFNVPEGKNKVDWDSQKDNIKKFSKFLKDPKVHIFNLNFRDFFKKFSPGNNDFVYMDPPYWDTFTSYDGCGFNEQDQLDLHEISKTLKCEVVCSNSNTEFIKTLYGSNFNIHEVDVRRSINSDAKKRNGVEIIMKKNLSK